MDWRRKINSVINGAGPEIVFQGIYRLSDLKRVGFESLSRFPEERTLTDSEMFNIHGPDWKNNAYRGLGPNDWFRNADKLGLGVDLELSALANSFSYIPLLPNNNYIAVNVGPETLMSDTLTELLNTIDVSRVVVEITEHLSIPNYDIVKQRVLDIQKQCSVQMCTKIPYIAADDIGAGEASILHLLELREVLTFAKLDIRMTKLIEIDPGRQEMAAAIVNIGRIYGYKVVAEGVEREIQLNKLIELGVYAGQGWHLHKPQPLSEIEII